MKKSSGIVIFIMIANIVSAHAMELVELTSLSKKLPLTNRYGLLAEDTLDMIQEQKTTLFSSMVMDPVRSYYNVVHSSLKLDQLYGIFCALSEPCKYEVMKTMSIQLLYLHAIALYFPPEIVKDHIILYMLDGEKEAVEKFYALPFT